jgi:HAE1 family hydrophobic/amphiphilic exporter-1
MNLSEPFIRRPVMTILCMAAVLFFGAAAYKKLPVSDLPAVDFPTIQVKVSYPGANPETMASAVATPLEQQFMTLEGLQSIFSSSNNGSTTIVLQFSLDRDIDAASTEVQAAISTAQPNLPSDLPNNPTYRKVNPAATPILYLAFVADTMTLSDLYEYASTFIGQRLSMVNGVSQVITYGSPYAVRVQVDPEKLAARQIGLDQVTEAIQQANVDLPVGTLWGRTDDFSINVDGQLTRAPPYAEIVIKNSDGDLVKIKDVGRALDSVENDKFFMRYVTREKDEPCVILAIQRQPGANTVKIIEGINQTIEHLRPQLPAALQIFRIYDQSISILESIADVKFTLFVALILVVFIIYLSLGKLFNTLVPSLAIPISVLGTFGAMYLFGYSVDILSLLAITLSIGFLVDDAIVVLENNVRHVQLGEAPFEGTIAGSKEISTTVLSMTICLASAFIPMLFMSGIVGRLFREFAVTIVTAVLISGFVSLTLTPMLSARFIKPYHLNKKAKMEHFADWAFEKLTHLYKPCLEWAMRHRLLILGLGTLSVFSSYALLKILPKDFLPAEDVGFIQGYALARDGTSPYQMLNYHQEIYNVMKNDPNVESVISVSSYTNANEGIFFLRLRPFHERRPMREVIKELWPKVRAFPGVTTYIFPLPLINLQIGTTAQGLYQYSLSSLDREALYQYAPKLFAAMRDDPHFYGVASDLRIRQPEWNLSIQRDKAYNYNVSAHQIESFLEYAYSNNKISQINGEINQYDVLLETLPQFYRDPTVLSKLYVRSTTGYLVPLSELVEPSQRISPLTVNHLNGLPVVGISFNVPDEVPLDAALQAIDSYTEGQLPQSVGGRVIGTAAIFTSSFESLFALLIFALFAIYMILGILYESFIHPLTVMSALPPALLGGLFTLYIFGERLSIYSFVGLVLLIGTVLKNGIILVDFANDEINLRKKTAYDAIVSASLTRLRPILMTTFSSFFGALPIALGVGGAIAQARIPLGLAITGGLVVSQILTLLLTPVLYYYFEILQEKVRHWRAPTQ